MANQDSALHVQRCQALVADIDAVNDGVDRNPTDDQGDLR